MANQMNTFTRRKDYQFIDTWHVPYHRLKVENCPPVVIIAGLGVRPPSLMETYEALDSLPDLYYQNQELDRQIAKGSYLGNLPLKLARYTSKPVHILWQPPETEGKLFPVYNHDSIHLMLKGLEALAKESKELLFLISHSIGSWTHTKALSRPNNYLPGVVASPIKDIKEVLSSLGPFQGAAHGIYRMLSKFSLPGYNIVSNGYFHNSGSEKPQSKYQCQNPRINTSSSAFLLDYSLTDTFPSINGPAPEVVVTLNDKLISPSSQKDIAVRLGADVHELSGAGHRFFTRQESADEFLGIILSAMNRQSKIKVEQ